MTLSVGVTGGRDYACRDRVFSVLKRLKIDILHIGDASGADEFARLWADEHGVPVIIHEAEWNKYGKGAGPIRNRHLVRSVDLLVAFPGGRGTANCVEQALKEGVIVLRVECED